MRETGGVEKMLNVLNEPRMLVRCGVVVLGLRFFVFFRHEFKEHPQQQ